MPYSLDSVLLHCEEYVQNIRNFLDIDSFIKFEKAINRFLGRNKVTIHKLKGLFHPIFEYKKNKFIIELYISKDLYYTIIRVDGITFSYVKK